MNTPITFALISLVAGGLMAFCWQIASSNGVYTPSFMLVDTLVFGLVAVALHLVQRHTFTLPPRMILVASFGGLFGAMSFVALMLAMSLGGEGSIIFPIKSLSVVVVVLLSFVIFREPVTINKVLGLGFASTAVVLLSR